MGKAEDGTFSVRGLIRLIIPLMIGLTLDLIVGIIDSVMLSGSGESAVSGVSLVDSLIQLLIYIFAALAAGGAIIAGQYPGAKTTMVLSLIMNAINVAGNFILIYGFHLGARGDCNTRFPMDGGVWMRKGIVNPAR